MNEIVAFNQTKADIAEYKAENAKMVFDYEDEQGNKDARSHVYKLRKARTAFDKLRKETKAEALAACKDIDAQAKDISVEFDEMIAVHQDPIKRIEEREEAEKQAALDKIREDREKEEAARLADLEAKEAELKELKAKAKAEEDAKAQAEREKKIAEDAKIEAEQKAARDLKAAEEKRLADIAEVERKAKAEEVRIATELAAKEQAEAAEKARLAKIEADRIADLDHQNKVKGAIYTCVKEITGNATSAQGILDALVLNKIPNVTINY